MASLSPALDRLNDFVTRKLHEWRTPGLAVALTDRQNLLHLATYHAEGVTGMPITADTLFEIGSIGKSFLLKSVSFMPSPGLIRDRDTRQRQPKP